MNYSNKIKNERQFLLKRLPKTLKTLLLGLVLSFSSAVLANTHPTSKSEKTKSITQTVERLLKQPNFEVKEDIKVLVYIYINTQDEIVVLSLDTEDEGVEGFIKTRLNYQKLTKNVANHGKVFKLPVKIQALN